MGKPGKKRGFYKSQKRLGKGPMQTMPELLVDVLGTLKNLQCISKITFYRLYLVFIRRAHLFVWSWGSFHRQKSQCHTVLDYCYSGL